MSDETLVNVTIITIGLVVGLGMIFVRQPQTNPGNQIEFDPVHVTIITNQ